MEETARIKPRGGQKQNIFLGTEGKPAQLDYNERMERVDQDLGCGPADHTGLADSPKEVDFL